MQPLLGQQPTHQAEHMRAERARPLTCFAGSISIATCSALRRSPGLHCVASVCETAATDKRVLLHILRDMQPQTLVHKTTWYAQGTCAYS
jgi:hypothetical protein